MVEFFGTTVNINITKLNGVSLASVDEGEKTNPAILLIMGHGATMFQWPKKDMK